KHRNKKNDQAVGGAVQHPYQKLLYHCIIGLFVRQVAQRYTPYRYRKRLGGSIAAHSCNYRHVSSYGGQLRNRGIKMADNRSSKVCRCKVYHQPWKAAFYSLLPVTA